MINLNPAARGGSAQARRFRLLKVLRDQGRLEVSSATGLLGVSPETLRRDLRLLEAQGLVSRRYGMAYPVETGTFETSFEIRAGIHPEEKMRLAAAAVSRIGEAQILFVDEGFGMQLLAQRLPEDRPLTVVTACLPIASLLASRPNMRVIVVGGRLRANTMGVVDQWAADLLSRLTIDLAFIGANGISVERGLTTPDPAVAVVKEAAVKASVRRIFVGAHHKFGRVTFVRFAGVDQFECLITGHELSSSRAAHYSGTGAQIVRV